MLCVMQHSKGFFLLFGVFVFVADVDFAYLYGCFLLVCRLCGWGIFDRCLLKNASKRSP